MQSILSITRTLQQAAVKLHVFALKAQVRAIRVAAIEKRDEVKFAEAGVRYAQHLAYRATQSAEAYEAHADVVAEEAAAEAASLGVTLQ